MGQAVDFVSNAEANPRKRVEKAFRGHGYTGNLTAFKQSQGMDNATRASTAFARFTAMQPTAEKNSHLSYDFAADARRSASNAHSNAFPASSDDSLSSQLIRKFQVSPKRNLAAAVVGSLTVGAILGSVWSMSDEQPTVGVEAITAQVDRGATINANSVITETVNGVEAGMFSNTSASSDALSGVVIGENPTLPPESTPEYRALEAQVEGYQEEIEWLNSQNVALTEKVDMLSSETLKLNRDLLGLELELAQTEPTIETRTVYNFVNVPIGGGAVAENVQSYSEPVVYEEDTSYAQDQYMQEQDYAEGQEAYAESLEYREAYGFPEEPQEPVYDPETGLYLSPEMLGGDQRFYEEEQYDDTQQYYEQQQYDSGQQYIEQDTQVIYPPIAPDSY